MKSLSHPSQQVTALVSVCILPDILHAGTSKLEYVV